MPLGSPISISKIVNTKLQQRNKGRVMKDLVSSGVKIFVIPTDKELDFLRFYLKAKETLNGKWQINYGFMTSYRNKKWTSYIYFPLDVIFVYILTFIFLSITIIFSFCLSLITLYKDHC